MKRINYYIFLTGIFQLLLFCSFTSSVQTVHAEQANADKTDTAIMFEESTTVVPSKTKPPVIVKPVGPTRDQQLPHLGQLITSIILLLIGICVLIVFVGVFSLKQLYYTNTIKEV